jgi:uncharacterized membrane protein
VNKSSGISKGKRQHRTGKPPAAGSSEPVHRAWIPSAVGLGVSAYLLILDLMGAPAYCLAQYGCDIVRTSAFSRILGVPVAAAGVVFFAAALGLCLAPTSMRYRWLVPLAGIGAGGALIFVSLQLAVIHAVCPYCLIADAAAFGFAYLVLKDSPPPDKVRAAWVAALAAVVLSAIYVLTPAPPAGSDYATRLARHLSQSGVVMYGAYWCPHCRDQKAMFGPAASLLPYVECDPRGAHAQPDNCRARGIRVYPTWDFHGRLEEGALTLDELAQRSGYPSRPPGP